VSRLQRYLAAVQTRPGMYIGDTTLSTLRVHLDGYLLGLVASEGDDSIEARQIRRFNTFVRTRFGVTGWQDWDHVLQVHAHNDEAALRDFFSHWNSFLSADSLEETALDSAKGVAPLLAALAASTSSRLQALVAAVEQNTDLFLRAASLQELQRLMEGFCLAPDPSCPVGGSDQVEADSFRDWVKARYDDRSSGGWVSVLSPRFGGYGPIALADFHEHWRDFIIANSGTQSC
jgi:hypothetical protein